MNATAYRNRQRHFSILLVTCLALGGAVFGQSSWSSKSGPTETFPQDSPCGASKIAPGQASTVCFVSMQRMDPRWVTVLAWAGGSRVQRVQRVDFTTVGRSVTPGRALGNGYWTATVYAPRRSTLVTARTIVANRPDAAAYATTP